MRVLVLGAGIAGITTAWYLHRDGHEVTVVDRADAAARETSFANGGQLSWAAGNPWAAPGVIRQALHWLARAHAPLVLRPRLDPDLWPWLFQFLRQSSAAGYRRNKETLLRLAQLARREFLDMRAAEQITHHQTHHGVLLLFRDAAGLAKALRDAPLWSAHGVTHRLLDQDACLRHEPALQFSTAPLHGGLLFPEDEAGDCHGFAAAVQQRLAARGVRFHFGTRITALEHAGDRLTTVRTDQGAFNAEAYVLACGSYSPLLLRPLGIRLPVYPLKGYSLTLPITRDDAAPRGTITDEYYKVVVTRLGPQLRVAGTAELAGYDLSLPPQRLATLRHVLRALFPHAGDPEQAESWTGLRPMTPDNPPVLGPTPLRNLFLNTGHGTLGWTLSCGTARLVAEQIVGKTPAIDLTGLTLARFS